MSDDREDTLNLSSAGVGQTRTESGQACLIVLYPPGPHFGARFELTEERYLVGRELDFGITLRRESVSRRHAEVCLKDGRWHVRDLGSTNGTFVNDDRVTDSLLNDGDLLRFGDAILKFLSGDNVESGYHEEIFKMTIMDGLTGLPNRRHFLEFLSRELAVARRYEIPLSLVLFDLDDFKRINDARGHLGGDSVLRELAVRVRPRIRREDLMARYGGEEFAAVLVHTAEAGAVRFADHVRGLISGSPFMFAGEPFPLTTSAGVTTVHREPDITVDDVIARADKNLYLAKTRGRNQVVPNIADLTEISK